MLTLSSPIESENYDKSFLHHYYVFLTRFDI